MFKRTSSVVTFFLFSLWNLSQWMLRMTSVALNDILHSCQVLNPSLYQLAAVAFQAAQRSQSPCLCCLFIGESSFFHWAQITLIQEKTMKALRVKENRGNSAFKHWGILMWVCYYLMCVVLLHVRKLYLPIKVVSPLRSGTVLFLSLRLERQELGLCSLRLYSAFHMVDTVSFRMWDAYNTTVELLWASCRCLVCFKGKVEKGTGGGR